MPGKSIVNQSETELRSWILTASHPYAHAVLQLIVHALLDIYACIFTSLVHPSRIDCRRDCCIASRRHQAIDVRICREDFFEHPLQTDSHAKRLPVPYRDVHRGTDQFHAHARHGTRSFQLWGRGMRCSGNLRRTCPAPYRSPPAHRLRRCCRSNTPTRTPSG